MLNNETPVKIAKILSGESVDVDFNLSVGDGTTNSATPGDTAMDNELGRVECTLESNNDTGLISTQINAIDAAFAGETLSELGVFDKSSGGQLFDRATDFTAVTLESDTVYYNDNFYELSNSNNTDLNKITDNGISQIFAVLEGDTVDSPSHVGFSTHLILDQCEVVTGWSGSTDAIAVATNTNKQEGTLSLALGKSGTTEATFSYTKTLSVQVDMSDATTLRVWTRIDSLDNLNKLTTTNALKIRVGNNASNYLEQSFDKADLYVGWQLLEITIDDMTETGTFNAAEADYLYIEYNTNNTSDTIASGSVLMDFWSATWPLNDSDTELHEEVYREIITTIERVENEVRYRGLVAKADGNTYNYYYIGLFDAASSGDMYMVQELFLTRKDANTQLNFFITINVTIR